MRKPYIPTSDRDSRMVADSNPTDSHALISESDVMRRQHLQARGTELNRIAF